MECPREMRFRCPSPGLLACPSPGSVMVMIHAARQLIVFSLFPVSLETGGLSEQQSIWIGENKVEIGISFCKKSAR